MCTGRYAWFRIRHVRLDLDTSFVHQHVNVPVRAQADFELRADGAHYRITGVYQEGPRAVRGHLEVGLSLAQKDLARAAPDVRFDDCVGVERDEVPSASADIPMLPDCCGQRSGFHCLC